MSKTAANAMKHASLATTLALAAALFFVIGARSQDNPLSAALRPLLLDIQRSVPITLTVDVALPDGETETVAIPATVKLALFVDLSSPVSSTLSIGAETGPAEYDGPKPRMTGIDNQNIPYQIKNGTVVEIEQWRAKNVNGYFELIGKWRNTSETRTLESYEVDISITLYDSDGRVLDFGDTATALRTIGPGETTAFSTYISASFDEIANYVVEVQVSGE